MHVFRTTLPDAQYGSAACCTVVERAERSGDGWVPAEGDGTRPMETDKERLEKLEVGWAGMINGKPLKTLTQSSTNVGKVERDRRVTCNTVFRGAGRTAPLVHSSICVRCMCTFMC